MLKYVQILIVEDVNIMPIIVNINIANQLRGNPEQKRQNELRKRRIQLMKMH